VVSKNVLAYTFKVSAVDVDKPLALYTFQVEMLMTVVLAVDVLIAGTCFAIDDVLPYNALLYKLIKTAVDSRSTERSSLLGHIGAYRLDVNVLVFI